MSRRSPRLSEALGQAIRERRIERELTQEKLASRARVNRTYVSDLERGLKSPTLDVLDSLAAALKVEAHVLVEAAERVRSRNYAAEPKGKQRFRRSS